MGPLTTGSAAALLSHFCLDFDPALLVAQPVDRAAAEQRAIVGPGLTVFEGRSGDVAMQAVTTERMQPGTVDATVHHRRRART